MKGGVLVCTALLVLAVTLALGSPLDDSHRAALFRRTRIGPKDAAITRLAATHERQLRVAAVGGNLSSFSDYFLAHLRTHNAAVGFAFDRWEVPGAGVAGVAGSTEPAFYDEVDGIGDDAAAIALTHALNPPPPTDNTHTTTPTDTNTTALPAKVWVYKHEDQSRPGIPVADNQDTPAASGEVSPRAAKPPAKELPAPPSSDESSVAAAPSAPVAPGKPGLNRLFARKKYSPLLRSDGSLKGAASESATTVPSSTEADAGAPSEGPGSSVATSTRRTRPTRPGKVPRVTSPKPTVSVKPTKISSRFSKPTTEPTDSTVTPVTQRTTRGRRTRPSKPPKGGPVPVTEAATSSTAPPTTSTTTTTTTTPAPTTTSSTTTTTTTVTPTTSTAADPVVLVEGTSVVHSSVRGESSSSSASPVTTVTLTTTSTTTTTAASPPGDADDDEVPAPITTNGQQQPSEPVARPDRDRDDETLVFSRAPSGPKSDRVIPVVERQDDASVEDDSGPLRATSFERADDRK